MTSQQVQMAVITWGCLALLYVPFFVFRRKLPPLLSGALLGVFAVILLIAICALTVGIPVPFSGWFRGWKIAVLSPVLYVHFSLFVFGGLPIIVPAVLGAVVAVAVANRRKRDAV